MLPLVYRYVLSFYSTLETKYQNVCMEYAVLNCGKSIKKERVESLSPSLMVVDELLCHIAERLTWLPVEKSFSPLRRISWVSTHTPPSLQTTLDSHVISVSTKRLISLMYVLKLASAMVAGHVMMICATVWTNCWELGLKLLFESLMVNEKIPALIQKSAAAVSAEKGAKRSTSRIRSRSKKTRREWEYKNMNPPPSVPTDLVNFLDLNHSDSASFLKTHWYLISCALPPPRFQLPPPS